MMQFCPEKRGFIDGSSGKNIFLADGTTFDEQQYKQLLITIK
jgi:hypothetical protein